MSTAEQKELIFVSSTRIEREDTLSVTVLTDGVAIEYVRTITTRTPLTKPNKPQQCNVMSPSGHNLETEIVTTALVRRTAHFTPEQIGLLDRVVLEDLIGMELAREVLRLWRLKNLGRLGNAGDYGVFHVERYDNAVAKRMGDEWSTHEERRY